MKIIKGEYNEAKVFTDNIDEVCIDQIKGLLDLETFRDAQVRIMPDCHAGASCVIGFTANLGDKVIPNIVGVDIGCGMYTVELGKINIDFERLDQIIRKYIPSGREVHEGRLMNFQELQEMYCYRELNDVKRLHRSIGTLGGGNHFIEIDVDEDDNKYLVIHTGSRHLGKQTAEIYQKMAIGLHTGKEKLWEDQERLIREYKEVGRRTEIQEAIKELHRQFRQTAPDLPHEFCFLYGKYTEQYLHDMKICQRFADENRKMIAKLIIDNYGFDPIGEFTTIHNYIDHESNIIRKGAISAKKGEKVIIPINMRDGSLICIGKGNKDWNESAPHGAGRICSRSAAKKLFTVEEYEKVMIDANIFSTSINQATIDECPMVYKNIDDIVNNIGDTVEIISHVKPIYNFKAGDDEPSWVKNKKNKEE